MTQPELQNECWKAYYRTGDLDFVKYCLENGMDINARAQISGAVPLGSSIYGGHRPIFDYLISQGADVNAVGYEEGMMLMAAANLGVPDMLKILLENGAGPNLASLLTDDRGESPLTGIAGSGEQLSL